MSCADDRSQDDRFTDERLLFDLDGGDCDPDWQLNPMWWRMPWPVYRETAHADRVRIAKRYRTAI